MFRFQSGARMSLGPDKRARVPGRLLLFRNTSALKTTEIPPFSWSPSAPKPFLGAQGHLGSDV